MKMKRPVVLLIAVVLLVAMAPAAFAEHCWKCKIYMGSWSECLPATGVIGGYTTCVPLDGPACTVGEACAPHGASLMPLAAQYQVASVERLDEPRAATNETLVASATDLAAATTLSPAAR